MSGIDRVGRKQGATVREIRTDEEIRFYDGVVVTFKFLSQSLVCTSMNCCYRKKYYLKILTNPGKALETKSVVVVKMM